MVCAAGKETAIQRHSAATVDRHGIINCREIVAWLNRANEAHVNEIRRGRVVCRLDGGA